MAGQEVKKVFLSSTAKDLAAYRDAVIKAIDDLDGYDSVRMETFGARDSIPLELCQEMVRKCQLFVGILGLCYGSSAPDDPTSFTKQEYDEARELGLPRLMFVSTPELPVRGDLIEPDDLRQKQSVFRENVGKECVCQPFDTPDVLAQKVIAAIRNWEQEHARESALFQSPGDALLGAGDLQTSVFNAPSAYYFPSRYNLEKNFTGRRFERSRLTEWFISSGVNVMAIESIGGMGKTSLAWVWLQSDVLGGDLEKFTPLAPVPHEFRPEGIFWWSFAGEGARFPHLVDEALRNFGKDPSAFHSYRLKVRELMTVLESGGYLLVLDGFERQLRGFAGLEERGEEEELNQLDPHEPRGCIDPLASTFLESLGAAPLKSRILLTTQAIPKELDRAVCFSSEQLQGLSAEDTETLFRLEGIQSDRSEVDRICAPCAYHPLSVRLLIGLIKSDPNSLHDIRAISDAALTLELQKGQGVVELSLRRLTQEDLDLLCFLAAFRFPVNYPTLEANKPVESEDSLRQGLIRLQDRRLIRRDDESGCYDLHPIVRNCAYQKLPDPREIHKKLRKYYERFPGNEGVVASVADLSWIIERYHHTVRAENFDDARHQLERDLVPQPLDYLFGAYPIIQQLLRELFPNGEERDPALEQTADKVWALGELANAYSMTGYPVRAEQLFERLFQLQDSLPENAYVARAMFNRAHLQMLVGELRNAEDSLRGSIRVGNLINSPLDSAIGHQELGRLYSFMGLYDEACDELEEAAKIFKELKRLQPQAVIEAYQSVRLLLRRGPEQGAVHALKTRILAEQRAQKTFPVERDFVRADWLTGWAAMEMAERAPLDRRSSWLSEAELHLAEGLPRCRENGLISLEPNILLAFARCYRLRENREGAIAETERALKIADGCHYRLKQADIHNFLARLALDERDIEKAKHHAEIAKDRAWCDGPPHYYKGAFEQAERLLAEPLPI